MGLAAPRLPGELTAVPRSLTAGPGASQDEGGPLTWFNLVIVPRD